MFRELTHPRENCYPRISKDLYLSQNIQIYKPKSCHEIILSITVWPKFSLILVQWIVANRNSQVFWVRICQENPRGKISCLPQPYSSGRARAIDTQDHQWSRNTCDNVTEYYYMENNARYERTASLPPEYTHSPMLSWLNIGNKDGRIQDKRIQEINF